MTTWDSVSYLTATDLHVIKSSDSALILRTGKSDGFWFGADVPGLYVDSWERPGAFREEPIFRRPQFQWDEVLHVVYLPFWILAGASVTMGSALLLSKRPVRFSLRTLAVAATFIIVTLGLGVAASQVEEREPLSVPNYMLFGVPASR